MLEHRRNDHLTPIYTWFVLMQLDQHHKEFMDGSRLKIRELALHKGSNGHGDLRRAAESLAMPLMNLYSALGGAELKRDVSPEQAKEKVVCVLLDKEKTVTDLAAALDACYLCPDVSRLA
jgi:hypothetical protein